MSPKTNRCNIKLWRKKTWTVLAERYQQTFLKFAIVCLKRILPFYAYKGNRILPIVCFKTISAFTSSVSLHHN